jgi:hypothetical protein
VLDGPIEEFALYRNLPISDQQEMMEFVSDCALEIYGKGDLVTPNAMRELNYIASTVAGSDYEVVLLSREIARTKPATLFFLSDSGCEVDNIRFTDSYADIWETSHIVMTGNPTILENRPEGKRVIVFDNEYNKNLQVSGEGTARVASMYEAMGVLSREDFM